jgi:molybdopterin synthase catalytic subunit
MVVKVRLFAILKQRAECGETELDVPAGSTASQIAEEVGRRFDISDLIAAVPFVCAVNREYADADATLADGDELALIPPVSGGAPLPGERRVHAEIVAVEPSGDRLTQLVTDPAAGAVVVFHGVTREVSRLEYECYVEMAGPMLQKLLEEVAEEFDLVAIAAEHRIGSVPLGESSVVIAASAAHRAEAFAGARAAIDRIKDGLPVWKREVIEDEGTESSEWVDGTTVGGVAR